MSSIAGPRDDAGFAIEVVAPLLRPEQTRARHGPGHAAGADDGSVGYDRVARPWSTRPVRAGRGVPDRGRPDALRHRLVCGRTARAEQPPTSRSRSCRASAPSCGRGARLGWPLARKEEILTVCPATYHADEIGADPRPRRAGLLAQGRRRPAAAGRGTAPSRARLDRAALVERVGRPDERIFHDLTEALGETCPTSRWSWYAERWTRTRASGILSSSGSARARGPLTPDASAALDAADPSSATAATST